jgi:hypothetical protein
VLVCVLAYALWKPLDLLDNRAGLQTVIHKLDAKRDKASPKPRPMTPEVIQRELSQFQIGDIVLRRRTARSWPYAVARPNTEQARILTALKLPLPERLRPDRLL